MKTNQATTKEDSGTDDLPISAELLSILACPACDDRPSVTLTEDKQFLKCQQCSRKYPIKNSIPVMLVEEAVLDV